MFERNRDHPERKHAGDEKSHSPRLLIQCSDLFTSDIDGFKDATPCLEISTASERKVVKSGSGQIDGDGHISIQDVIVCMKYGSWGPKINAALLEGHKIDTIIIRRFVTMHKTMIVIQELTFSNCAIKKYTQDSDLIVFAFNFIEVEDTHIHYNEKGQKKGVTSAKFNTATLKGDK